jgi:hypothetical protein
MHVELAEVFRKPALLVRGERLTPEEQNLVFDQQFTEAVDGLPRQFFGECDALDNGAQGGGQAGNGDCHIAPSCHASPPRRETREFVHP